MHQLERIDRVERDTPYDPGVVGGDDVVVVRIGVGDAAAAWGDTLQPAAVERLEKNQQRSAPRPGAVMKAGT